MGADTEARETLRKAESHARYLRPRAP